jgi:hypothetical protein
MRLPDERQSIVPGRRIPVDIQEKHIQTKKRIGTLRGQPVVEVLTKGGFYLVVTQKNGALLTLGTGPHRAVARYIAQKREPDMTVMELSKSDHLDEQAILSVFKKYSDLTDFVNDVAQRE